MKTGGDDKGGERPKLTKAERVERSRIYQEQRRLVAAKRADDQAFRDIRDRKPARLREAAQRMAAATTPGYAKAKIASVNAAELSAKRSRLHRMAEWSHKREGTPETHDKASRQMQGALARLHLRELISSDQLAAAVEIAMVAERIESDVAVRTASLEARVDNSGAGRDVLIETLRRVRMEVAYTRWRDALPQPKRMILDMILGDPLPYTIAAKRYRIGHGRVLRMLQTALNEWPSFLDVAEQDIDEQDLFLVHEALA